MRASELKRGARALRAFVKLIERNPENANAAGKMGYYPPKILELAEIFEKNAKKWEGRS